MNITQAIAFLRQAQERYGDLILRDNCGWEIEHMDVVRIGGETEPNIKVYSVSLDDFPEDEVLLEQKFT